MSGLSLPLSPVESCRSLQTRNRLPPAFNALCRMAFDYLGRNDLLNSGELDASKGRIRLRPGPWGDVEYLPITIAPPRKLLRVQAIEDQAPH